MSFLKIKDPIKRDLIVEEFLKTKKNIQEKFITESLGDISAQRELSKLFKPITETQKDIKESLVSELKPIKESLKKLPAASQLRAIVAPPEDEDEEEGVMQVGRSLTNTSATTLPNKTSTRLLEYIRIRWTNCIT